MRYSPALQPWEVFGAWAESPFESLLSLRGLLCKRYYEQLLKRFYFAFDYFSASSRKDIRNKNAIEKARDSELVVKLVKIHHDGSTEFVVTTCLPVWIKVKYMRYKYVFNVHMHIFKASINPRDLNKAKRREPKGAAAQMAAQKRKVEEQQEIEKKKIRQEIIDDTTFIKRLKKNMKENNFSNELKHCILGLNNDNFKL